MGAEAEGVEEGGQIHSGIPQEHDGATTAADGVAVTAPSKLFDGLSARGDAVLVPPIFCLCRPLWHVSHTRTAESNPRS